MLTRFLSFGALSMFLGVGIDAQAVTPQSNPNRSALEQQFRVRSAKLAQQRLGLTDAQLAQLEQTNARFAPQLNQLVMDERETRRQLRVEMTSGNQANQQHVSALIDNSILLQKRRIALVEAEQKDLARFLTPTQRAGYLALQGQVRRRAQELSRDGGIKGGGPGGNRMRQPPKHLP
jgi:Spy/CpxP family protein refolding chaperone